MGSYIDIAIVVIFAIAFIVGLAKGFNKQFNGFAMSIGAIAGAVALALVLAPLLLKMPLILGLSDTIGGLFSDIAGADVVVNNATELATAMSQGPFAILTSSAPDLFPKMVEAGVDTIGSYLGFLILQFILDILIFVVTYLIIHYIFKALRQLLDRLNKRDFFRRVDRLFGAFLALAISYVLIIGVLLTAVEVLTAAFAHDINTVVVDTINQTSILVGLRNTNFLGIMLRDLIASTGLIPTP